MRLGVLLILEMGYSLSWSFCCRDRWLVKLMPRELMPEIMQILLVLMTLELLG